MRRLSESIVREIAATTGDQRKVAAEFGVSKSLIGYIRRGVVWAHLKLNVDADAIAHANNSAVRSGVRNAAAKLKPEQVIALRADPRPQHVAGRAYGVCKSTVGNIRSGKNWTGISA